MTSAWNACATAACAACTRRAVAALPRPARRAAARAAFAAASLRCLVSCSRRAKPSPSWRVASLMNVPGPKTSFTGCVRRSCPQGPFSPPDGVTFAGVLPEMQPSRPMRRSRSCVSRSLERSPRTRTMIGSSPKRARYVAVAP
jgi:hypothetical protein